MPVFAKRFFVKCAQIYEAYLEGTLTKFERTLIKKGVNSMERYLCEPCGYVYDPKVGDPDHDIPPGTAFEDLPEDWVCPWCGLGKDVFVKE